MIYPALLADDFVKLPPVLRAFHSSPGKRCAAGTVTVRHESALLAWLASFPKQGEQIPLRLDVAASEEEEIWTRWFGDAVRRSTQRAQGGLLVETAGPVRIGFRVDACEGGMQFRSIWTRLWGIPVPLRIEASARGGERSWEVVVTVAYVGSYRAVLTPQP